MKQSNRPLQLHLTGYRGRIKAEAAKMGSHRWFYKKHELNFFDIPEEFNFKNLVYLSPDAE